MYITIDEFVSMGGRNFDNVSEFDRLAKKAMSCIDLYTQGRLKTAGSVPGGVKDAMFELIELILAGGADVVSYSSDGVSVKLSEKASLDNKIYEIIRRNLPIELLYLGVDKNDK